MRHGLASPDGPVSITKDFEGEVLAAAAALMGLGLRRPGSTALCDRGASGEDGMVIGSGDVERDECAMFSEGCGQYQISNLCWAVLLAGVYSNLAGVVSVRMLWVECGMSGQKRRSELLNTTY